MITQGSTPPLITADYAGFKNHDTVASLTTAASCSTTATSISPAGLYPSSCSGAVDPNYLITYNDGLVVVISPHGREGHFQEG